MFLSKVPRGDAALTRELDEVELEFARVGSDITCTVDFDAVRTWDVNSVRRWRLGKPQPSHRNAWILGEACWRRGVPWFSGLAGLNVFQQDADFVAVLAIEDETDLFPNARDLAAMIVTTDAARYSSPFDVVTADHDIFKGKCDIYMLEEVRAGKTIQGIPIALSLLAEARALNERSLAWKVWGAIDNDLRRSLRRRAYRWFSLRSADERSEVVRRFPGRLRIAYNVAAMQGENRLDPQSRLMLVRDMLFGWLCTLYGGDLDDALRLVPEIKGDPHGALSRRAQLMLFIEARLREVVDGITLGELDLADFLRMYLCVKADERLESRSKTGAKMRDPDRPAR